MMLSDELRQARYDVIEAVTADEAYSILYTDVEIGLIITDVRTPGPLEGTGLARLARAEFSGVKVIITTAHMPKSDVGDVDGYFSKPYDPYLIVALVKALLSEGKG
jgi:DNA-binding response OmpR family regulator